MIVEPLTLEEKKAAAVGAKIRYKNQRGYLRTAKVLEITSSGYVTDKGLVAFDAVVRINPDGKGGFDI
ncbi:MAG: hypothetical protein N2318_10880 [Meiothermus sp.]|nr:hypothetical protein [Meiothermus sp.]